MAKMERTMIMLKNEAKQMIDEIAEQGCEGCLNQVIKVLSMVKDAHNAQSCARFKDYRCYEFKNAALEKKVRKILR